MGAMYQGRQMEKKKSSSQGVFSFMENESVNRRVQRPQRLLKVEGTRGRPGQQPHWLDAMLGAGSRKKIKRGTSRVLESNARLTRPEIPRSQSKQAGLVPARPRRGWIRIGLAAGVLIWSLTIIRPWDHLRNMVDHLQASREGKAVEVAAQPRPAEGPAEAEAALPQETVPLKLTPVIPGLRGGPVALWEGRSGTWFQVDAQGNLDKTEGPALAENLGLPILQGVGSRKVPDGDRLVLKLESDGKLLASLFPLHSDLAPEIATVKLNDTRNPVLVTVSGVTVPMGEGEYQTKQARLALVLNDLAAKKRRAVQVDMRYSNSAVVKLKGK